MEFVINLPPGGVRTAVFGPSERNLKMLRESLGISISARDGRVIMTGNRDGVAVARNVLETLISGGEHAPLNRQQMLDLVAHEASNLREGEGSITEDWDGRLSVYAAGRPIKPKTTNQHLYLDAIRDNDLVFALGPAGTGKTYLAVAAAVHLLRQERVKRVILARPAVEAGEKLGFLPGDLRAKVNPYLRPLFDALADMMDYGSLRRFMENDIIEVSPLAFMRGRTLNNAVIILDEAQNTTKGQMKMFLTRMGQGSKAIVTGDPTQTDLPESEDSGLMDAARRLRSTQGIGFVAFDRSDVVRHSLVQRIIDAYGEEDSHLHTRHPRTRAPHQKPGAERPGPSQPQAASE